MISEGHSQTPGKGASPLCTPQLSSACLCRSKTITQHASQRIRYPWHQHDSPVQSVNLTEDEVRLDLKDRGIEECIFWPIVVSFQSLPVPSELMASLTRPAPCLPRRALPASRLDTACRSIGAPARPQSSRDRDRGRVPDLCTPVPSMSAPRRSSRRCKAVCSYRCASRTTVDRCPEESWWVRRIPLPRHRHQGEDGRRWKGSPMSRRHPSSAPRLF